VGAHLLTGFPGFIASHLALQLFEDRVTEQLYAIVLSNEMEKARKKAQALKNRYPTCKVELLEGDITLPNLGLGDMELAAIASHTHIVWHLAAIDDLAVERKAAWKVNVHGTANVNDFVRTLPKLQRYMYFSTASVAGRRCGCLLETELVRPPAFKNYYEETKYEAELRVEDLKPQVPLTIIRPGIVCGHAETGETAKFDGPYFFLNMMDALRGLPFIPYMGSKKAAINIVPVDYVVRAAAHICKVQEAEGKTFHLTDPKPPKVYKMYREMVKQLTGRQVAGRIPLSLMKKIVENYKIRKKLGVEYESLDYLAWQAEFDVSNTQEVLQNTNISCPDTIEIIPILVDYYKKNKYRQELLIPIK
jgi:nucleoside-diphosphate-sugar epimerase